MNGQFRDQVNTARRAGYSEADILRYVTSQNQDVAAKVDEALSQGYAADEIMAFLAPTPTFGETVERGAGIVSRAALPYATVAAAGAPFGPIGVISALLAQGLSDAAIIAYNAMVPETEQIATTTEGLRTLYDKLGMGGVQPETRGERMLGSATEATVGAVPMVRAGQIGRSLPGGAGAVATEVSRAPITQIVSAPPIAAGTQFVGEATGSPLAALFTGVGAGTAAGYRPRIRSGAPTRESLKEQIADKYKTLNTSGVMVDDTGFRNSVTGAVFKDLRAEGYTPTNPKLAGITNLIDELVTNQQPKDIVELQAIRKQITNSASPNEPEAYRMMKIIRDRFDDYVENIPDEQVIAGDKKALSAWNQARKLFQTDRKAEVFTDILEKAPISKGQFSQSGMENYLFNELKKIARNDKTMRLFTKSEQEAIKKASETTNLQLLLKTVGKISPTGTIPILGLLGLGTVSPEAAALVGAAGVGGRFGAEQIRIGSIERIIDQILTGQAQPSPTLNVPATAARGLLSTELE